MEGCTCISKTLLPLIASKTKEWLAKHFLDNITSNIYPPSYRFNPIYYSISDIIEWEANKHAQNIKDLCKDAI